VFNLGPLPFLKPLAEMAATINGKRQPPLKPSASPRLLLSWFLFKLEPELLLPPLPSLCKHARSSNPSTLVVASFTRHRRELVATGEGLAPPLSFLASWVRQRLTELVLPQVYAPAPVARRSRAPTTPERRRSAAIAGPRPRSIFHAGQLVFVVLEW
jgi:hypothetical protein